MTDEDSGQITQEELEQLFDIIEDDPEAVSDRLEGISSIVGLEVAPALNAIGLLVDVSTDLRDEEGLKRAIAWADELRERDLSPPAETRLHYRIANAHSQIRKLSWESDDPWVWDDARLEEEILHFRKALNPEGAEAVPKFEEAQIYTNLGNVLSEVGRVIEAIDAWDTALDRKPGFPPARGQIGIELVSYSQAHHDPGHQALFLRMAYDELEAALEGDIHPEMVRRFESYHRLIENVLTPEALETEPDLYEFSPGESEREEAYREWCLENRLFLNPLNDLGAYPIAARDVLHLPSVTDGDDGRIISCVGLYNHMKQEFVSARYLLYRGIHREEPHFSDRDVTLINTLDYPSHAFSVENVKAAYRISYSIFDKIGFFLNHYFDRGIADHLVSFRTVWESSPHSGTLTPLFDGRENWALRGLYWLSKDLQYKSGMYAEDSLEPGAEELSDVRNALEHRYLKLHSSLWGGESDDSLAKSLKRDVFEDKAVEMMGRVRASLIYLALAIRQEERWKAEEADDPVIPVHLGEWEDEWKR